MSDQQQNPDAAQTAAPQTGQTPPASSTSSAQPSAASSPAAETTTPAKRFAVYDKTYLRFVGKVHDTKKAATSEAKDRKLDKYEIREV